MALKYPPNFDPNRTYPKILDLDKIDVLVDSPLPGKYFTVSNLPSTLTLGKHSFGISLNLAVDENGRRLKPSSKVLFEFKDSNGNVIFSDLLKEMISDDFATAYVWIKEDPLRIYQDIADGVGSLTIVGELNNVPEQWQNKYNVRLVIPINISKYEPNNSMVIFKDVNKVTASLSEFFAQNELNNNYKYSHLKISASNLDTYAGQVDKIEVSYYQSGSQITASDGSPEYIVHDTVTVPRTGNDRVYENNMSSSTYSGINPKSVNIITLMPETMRPTQLKFRFRYLNPAGQYVQNVLDNNQIVTTDFGYFTVSGSNTVISDKDNLVTGSVYLGKSAGTGLELHGGSAFIRSIGYRGFISGTATPAQKQVFPEGHASGSGFMMWSGSALNDFSAGEYSGVGLELVHDSSSYFRFSTAQNGNTIGYGKNRPAGLDIRTNAFFVGKLDGTHISASQGKISISSSNFALSPEGNVTMSGEISASSGHIGNFEIVDGKISGSNITMDAVSASIYMTSKAPGSDPQSSGLERLADEYYIDFTPTGSSKVPFYVKFGPNFMVDHTGVLIASGAKFEGTITASAGVIGDFNIGSASLWAGGTETTPRFFLSGSPGTTDNFNKNMLFLSASSFQINNKGKIKSVAGTIGGFTIDSDELKSGTNIGLDSANKKLTINDTTFGNEGIQLEYNSGNPRFHIGEGGANATASFIKYENKKVIFGGGVTLSWGASGGEGVNLINTDDWRITSGSHFASSSDTPEHFNPTGTTIGGFKKENVIKEIVGPGSQSLVKAWGMIPADDDGSDGGWNSDFFPINNQKTYVFTEYVMFRTAMTGSFYFGLYAGKDNDNDGHSDGGLEISSSLAVGMGVHDITDNSAFSSPNDSGTGVGIKVRTNPYFFGGRIDTTLSQSSNIEKDKWYLCVAYMHPHDTTNRTNMGGMYDVETGAKMRTLTDFKWTPSSSVALHRTYHYYNTEGTNDGNTGNIHQWVTQPGVYESNGGQVNISNFIDIASAVAKGTYSGSQTFISEKSIFSPVIGGNTGYFNETFRVGSSATGIQITGSGAVPNIKSGDFATGPDGAGWMIDSSSAEFNSITVRGTVSASAGEIGGFSIDADEIKAGSTLILDSDTNSGEIKLGGATGITAGDGIYMAGDKKFRVGQASDNYIRFNNTANKLEIKTPSLTLDSAGNLTVSGTLSSSIGNIGGWTINSNYISKALTGHSTTATSRIYLSVANDNTQNIQQGLHIYRDDDDTTNGHVKVIRVGGLSDTTNLHATASNDFGIQVVKKDSDDNYSNILYIGKSEQKISGWNIGTSQITSNNLILDSAGTLQTSDFVTGQKGWKISSADNGKAEFENVVIRGTLASTTFEKETVNAVGGQLYVANSTVITGSGVAQADRTMSVVNVSGFSGSYTTGGEILSIKKSTGAGFSTEYVLVQSASRDFPASAYNFAGKLYVKRGYSGSAIGTHSSQSLGDAAGTPTAYSASQVITSTGRSGSGYIRINANPGDTATPYIDIVERTGSAIYDIQLKARLGDLSGVANTGPVPSKPGFGLYSENVYLAGTITASAGLIGGWTIDSSTISKIGSSTTDGIVIDSSNKVIQVHGDSGGVTANSRANARLLLGQVSTADYGVKGWDESGNRIFELSEARNEIAGWTFTDDKIYKSNVTMSSANGGFIDLSGSILLSGSGEGYLANRGIEWDKSGNLEISGSVTIGQNVEIKGNNGFQTIYFEDFSQYADGGALTGSGDSPRTDGGGEGFYPYLNFGSASIVEDSDAIYGGKSLKCGDDSGNDACWFSSNQLIPFNSHSLYEIEIRIKKTEADDDGTEYCGITCYRGNGTTKVTVHKPPQNSFSSQHYFALQGESVPNDGVYYTIKGYWKGRQTINGPAGGAEHQSITNPGCVSSGSAGTFDPDTEVKYFAPMFITNYNGKDGIAHIDYIKVSEFAAGGGTKISGDNIQTGIIRSNNYGASDGSEFNLKDGTFKLGGSSNPDLQYDGSTLIVSGTISSSIGNIGGWTIGKNSLETTGVKMNDSTQTEFISSSNFKVTHAGNITASNVNLSGVLSSSAGNIGGWTLGETSMSNAWTGYSGIKIGRTEGIVGKGISKHTFESFGGWFFFDVGHTSIPPGSGGYVIDDSGDEVWGGDDSPFGPDSSGGTD